MNGKGYEGTAGRCTEQAAAPAPGGICDIVRANTGILCDIDAGMDTLLELLAGTRNGDTANVASPPGCLIEETAEQSATLNEIRSKLARAIDTLRG